MKTFLLLLVSNLLIGQVHNPQFEEWDLHNGREKPAEWYCPNLCQSPACGPCDKIIEGPTDFAVRIHNVMPCVSPDNQAKSRGAGFIYDFFVPTSARFKISFDLTIDSVETPAEFIMTIGNFVWKTDQLISQRIEHEIILAHQPDSLVIQFMSKGYLKQNSLHDCDLGYISAIIDHIETEDIVNTQDISKPEIQIIPNPFTNELSIRSEWPSISWRLFDFTGHLIMDGNSTEIIGLNILPAGLYLIEVNAGTNTYFEKIVKE